VIGAGAMGPSVAAIAARFAPTVMVCRNPIRAGQIFTHGIRVTGQLNADSRPVIVPTIADLSGVGGVTHIFIATKTTSLPGVCTELKPALPEIALGTAPVRVISYQNGIDPGRLIIDALGITEVMRMVLNYGAVLDPTTGVVDGPMYSPPSHIGCLSAELIRDCELLASGFTDAGAETRYAPDIETAVWAKALLNAAISPVCALVNAPVGQMLESPSGEIATRLLDEGMAVADAAGITLEDDFRARANQIAERGAHHLPSMVSDIHNGRPTEVGQLNRQIVAAAERLGIEVPTHRTIVALIETFDWRVYQATSS